MHHQSKSNPKAESSENQIEETETVGPHKTERPIYDGVAETGVLYRNGVARRECA